MDSTRLSSTAVSSGKPDPDNDPDRSFVSIRNMTKGFDGRGSRIEILREAVLELSKGETLAVIGPSGIGKSTFLHILGALDRPDSGDFFYQGKDVFRMDDISLANFRNRCIGFVFQFHHLLPEFSALENAMMPGLIHGMPLDDIRDLAEAILTRVGLEDRLFHKITEMSGGEQQRVALGRALVLKPSILLADEPTGNLDTGNSRRIHELLMELNDELKMAMVVVTHNIELAKLMARRVTISDGKFLDLE